jgi:hypothetical protein
MFTYQDRSGGKPWGEWGLAAGRCAQSIANLPNCHCAPNGTEWPPFCRQRISRRSRISASNARSTPQKNHFVASARVFHQTPVRNFQSVNDLQHGQKTTTDKTRKSSSASAVLCAKPKPPETILCRRRATPGERRNPHFRPTRVDRLDHLATCVTCPSYRLVAQPFLTIMKASNNRTLGTFAAPSLFASDANLPS